MKKFLAVLLGGLMIFSMAACSKKSSKTNATAAGSEINSTAASSGTNTSTSNSDITIGVVMKTLNSEYWNRLNSGVKKAGKELGIDVKVLGPTSETAYNEQSDMIENMLTSGDVDALCLAPLQADMVATKLKNATIPVLFFDTDAEYDKKVAFIGTSNYDAAKMGGEYIAKLIGKGKKAVLIGGIQGNPSGEARMKGYRDALEAGGVEVLGLQYANAVADQAVKVMENFMQSYPEIDAVLSNNDPMILGAQRAAAQAGRANKMKFLGFDGETTTCQSILDGKITASVAQNPEEIGYQAVVNAVKAVKGEKVEKSIPVPTEIITKENAQEALKKRKQS